MPTERFEPVFTEFIPDRLDEGSLYVSMEYATAAHLCACGCGSQVVTPLSPAQWRLTFDGETVSLWPSIGSWQLAYRSHYVIEGNRVRWARQWSDAEIAEGRQRDRAQIAVHFEPGRVPSKGPPATDQRRWAKRARSLLGKRRRK